MTAKLATLSTAPSTDQALCDELAELRTQLAASENRYHTLVAHLSFGVQEEDYSEIKKLVDKLQLEGVDDIEGYFLNSPAILREMVGTIRVTSVSESLMKMYQAESKQAFIADQADYNSWWDAQWTIYYAAEIAGLASASKSYLAEYIDTRLDDSQYPTRTVVTLVRGYEDSWERVLTIHEDITDHKNAERSLIEARVQAKQAN